MAYLEVMESPRRMAGVGAPRDTVFGVLGKTEMSPLTRSLGGLVVTTTKVKAPKVAESANMAPKNSEHHIIGKAAKTHISGKHYGQVPYAGAFMAHAGASLS